MTRHWQAPRTAYELAAEWAATVADLTERRGGAHGLIQPPGIAKAWHDLPAAEQRDVLEALAAQARGAVWELQDRRTGSGEPLTIADSSYMIRVCEKSRDLMAAFLQDGGPTEWEMPACPHCAALIAEALINVQAGAIKALGADPVNVLRTLIDRTSPASVPGQRKSDGP